MFKFMRPPRNRAEAWRYALLNQLAFPGLGTILAGRNVGFAQAAIMLAGFFIAMGYICWFIFHQLRLLFDMSASAPQFNEARFAHWWIGALGFGLCFISWLWSFVSCVQFIKAAPENAPMPPPKIS
jgi:hypothetical protein